MKNHQARIAGFGAPLLLEAGFDESARKTRIAARIPRTSRTSPRLHLHRRAITLIELVVSLGILTLLLGLLLPALAGVQSASRSARCQSNLRQMALAAMQYANIYDAWPAAMRYEQVDGLLHQIAWDWETSFTGELIGPGPLWMFTDSPDDVQQCPSCHDETNFTGDPHTGYNYNTSYLGAEAPFPATGWSAVRRGIAPSACTRTTTCAIFGDGGFAGGTNKFMRAPMNERGEAGGLSIIYGGGQAHRHAGATNVAWLDGHVAPGPRALPGLHATDELLEGVMGFPANGFLSDDDSAYDPR